jgi:putative Mg2+ transporter-C (MgtC) family protein
MRGAERDGPQASDFERGNRGAGVTSCRAALTMHLFVGVNAELHDHLSLAFRLVLAPVLGGMLGQERQQHGKVAGLRTHMLVALASATFVVGTLAMTHGNQEDIARVVQGVAAGIGFIGAGTIMKHSDGDQIIGLTTAAGLWMAAAIGVAVGMGAIIVSMVGTFVGWFILEIVGRVESHPIERHP